MPCEPTDRQLGLSQRGVVLVVVLWVLILLSLIAGNLSLDGRGFARQTLNTVQGYKAMQAADGGLIWALWSLQQSGQQGWLADGSGRDMGLGEAHIRVEIYDESGKLDLNAAPTELLDALLEPVVDDDRSRSALVAAIEDWRDEDDLVRLNGAEEEEYLAAGRESGPANRRFREVDEVMSVLGMTADIYRHIRPNLTVLTGGRTINPQVAPFDVLMVLPNASETVVRDYIQARRDAWENGLQVPELPFDATPYVAEARQGRYFTVITEAVIDPYIHIRQAVQVTRGGQTLKVERRRLLFDDDESGSGPGDRRDEQ